MGNCMVAKKEKINRNKQLLIRNHKYKIDLIKLLNMMKSPQIEQILQKIQYYCRNQKTKLINYTLFLEIFPKLKKEEINFGIGILKTFFEFFDQSKDCLINQRQVVNTLAIINNSHQKQFIQILLLVFGITKANITDQLIQQFGLRTKQMKKNKKSNKPSSEYSKINLPKIPLKNGNPNNETKQQKYQRLVASVPINYDLQQFRNLFDLLNCDQQRKMIQDYKENFDKYLTREFNQNIKQVNYMNTIDPQKLDQEFHFRQSKRILDSEERNNIQRLRQLNQDPTHLIIKIKINQPVFLVQINWFNLWRAYIKKFSISKIQFEVQGVVPENKENIFVAESQETKEKKRAVRPGKIQNYKLLGQYQGQINYTQFKIFKDFVIFPKQIWENICQLYKVEPEIQRKNPEFDPLIIYRVFTQNGIFVEEKKIQYSLRRMHKVKDIFTNEKNLENKIIYISQEPALEKLENEQFTYIRWKKIDIKQEFKQRQNYRHLFITAVQEQYQQLFEQNYLNFNENISYGETIEVVFSNKQIIRQRFMTQKNATSSSVVKQKKKSNIKGENSVMKKKIENKKQKKQRQRQNETEYIKRKLQKGRIVEISKDKVKVHFKDKKFYCDKTFTFKQINQIKKSFKNIRQNNQEAQIFAPKFYPIIPLFKKKFNQNGQFKTSYLCCIIRCLMQTVYFKQLLVKRKYRVESYKGFQFQNTLIQQLSGIARKNKQNVPMVEYSDFFTCLIDRMPEYKNLQKQHAPDKFIKQLLLKLDDEIKSQLKKIQVENQKLQNMPKKEIEKQRQKFFGIKIQQQIKNNNSKQQIKNHNIKQQIKNNNNKQQAQQSMFTDNDLIKRLFMFQYNQTRSCNQCSNFLYTKSKEFILSLKINQDEEFFFQGIFHPLVGNRIIKFGILMKLGKKFIDLAEQFLTQIKDEYPNMTLKNLHFSLQKSGEFQKHFEGQDFDSTLKFLNLKRNKVISIYEIKQIVYSQKELQQQKRIQNNRNLVFQKNTYVDFKNYSQWKIAKLIDLQGNQAKIKNYQYPKATKVHINKIAPFKLKTFYKTPYIIEIVHRRIKDGKVRHNTGVKPFIIYVTQLMSLQQIEAMIVDQIKKYQQIKIRDKTNTGHKVQKISSIQKLYKSSKNTQQQKVKQKMILGEITDQKYNIRYLKHKSGDLCYFCNKKSKIYFKKQGQQEYQKKSQSAQDVNFKQLKGTPKQQQIIQQKLQRINQNSEKKEVDTQSRADTAKFDDWSMNDKFCLGTHTCEKTQSIKKNPIGCHVDLKKFYVSIDWSIQIYEEQAEQHESYQRAKIIKQSNFSKIYESFSFLQSKIDDKLQCEKCKFHGAAVRRYISVVPNILIIKFERYLMTPTGCDKLDNKIELLEQLSLKIITNPVNNEDIYQLYAIVSCKQQNQDTEQSGYYYCYYLNEKNYWIRTDNQTAYYQDLKDIKHNQIVMLFYRKKIIQGYLVSLLV